MAISPSHILYATHISLQLVHVMGQKNPWGRGSGQWRVRVRVTPMYGMFPLLYSALLRAGIPAKSLQRSSRRPLAEPPRFQSAAADMFHFSQHRTTHSLLSDQQLMTWETFPLYVRAKTPILLLLSQINRH